MANAPRRRGGDGEEIGNAKDAKETQRYAMASEEDIGRAIIGAAMKVHTIAGPGLLESAYETCLISELEKNRLKARKQVAVAMRYEDLTIDNGYRIDFLVEYLVVVELKAVPTILPVHRAQLLSYLRLDGFKLGYLLNFNVSHMRDGILRLVNRL
ncbi:MAG TPA: GxxExxY protein [Stellaceae bacterium]|nr:GxxExxY protein [Stellaceae bacterium]